MGAANRRTTCDAEREREGGREGGGRERERERKRVCVREREPTRGQTKRESQAFQRFFAGRGNRSFLWVRPRGGLMFSMDIFFSC